MAITYPVTLDSFTDKVDNVDDVQAVDINDVQDAVEALETKVGVNSSAVATTIDYLLKSTSSANPGHKHTLVNSATDVTATAAEINTACDGVLATAAEINTACDGATAKNSHTHDQAGLAAAAVGQAQLKTAMHEQSTASSTWVEMTLTYCEYGFGLQIKTSTAGYPAQLKYPDETNYQATASTSYVPQCVYLRRSGIAGTAYMTQRYVTASGEMFWVWLLRDKITKEILNAEACSDHCSFGYKDPSEREHPFMNYDPDKHEIILWNPDKTELEKIYEIENGRGVLQTVLEDFEVDEKSQAIWPDIPVTVKIKNHDWFDRYIGKEPVDIIKKVIPKVGYIKCLKMRKKA